MTNLVNGAYGDGTFTYENNIWNVEDVDNSYEKAPVGSFSENVGREVVMVIDSDKNIVRAAYILSTLDGVYAGQISVATAAETGVNTNSTKLATATVTKPAGGTGALTYEWFKCDDAAGSKPVSLKNDANYTVSSSGVTSVLNVKAGVPTAGDHYFKVVATYTETGKVATTADDVVKVTVAAAPAAGSLSISNTDLATPTVMKNGTPATVAAGTSLYLGFSEGDKVQIVSSDIKANSYWKVAGTVYQASGAGILSFTMPKTDLTIAKADQQVKYTLGEGVSLTGTGYDAATGYAPVGTTVTIKVETTNGTGVLLSNDGELKSAATGSTVGSAIANSGTFKPTANESDVYMNAASILTLSAGTGTAPTAKLTNGGTALTGGHYVATGLNVTLTCGANNETIAWTVTSLTVGNGITEVTAPGAAAAGVYTFDMPATGLTATENT